jgi:hypothetical protein
LVLSLDRNHLVQPARCGQTWTVLGAMAMVSTLTTMMIPSSGCRQPRKTITMADRSMIPAEAAEAVLVPAAAAEIPAAPRIPDPATTAAMTMAAAGLQSFRQSSSKQAAGNACGFVLLVASQSCRQSRQGVFESPMIIVADDY